MGGPEKRRVLAVALDNLVTVNIESKALVEAYVAVDRFCRSVAGGGRTFVDRLTALLCDLPLITTDKDFSRWIGS